MKLILLAAVVTGALVGVSTATAGGALTACDGIAGCSASTITSADGVYFTVSTGGGNRDFASVEVTCDNGYSTVLNVVVPPKSSGTSQTIYPPAGSCVANLEKQMQIGKARILASVDFMVTP
jgi:hypothetical protein